MEFGSESAFGAGALGFGERGGDALGDRNRCDDELCDAGAGREGDHSWGSLSWPCFSGELLEIGAHPVAALDPVHTEQKFVVGSQQGVIFGIRR